MIKKLKIKYFQGIFSRDKLPNKINKECGIINLDTQIGLGTHWICYTNLDGKYCEYFDSFGLVMPKEIQLYLSTSKKQIIYSGDEIQERTSVLCGYWCLYYSNERKKGKSMLETIHNPLFDMSDQNINHQFIINYFKNR